MFAYPEHFINQSINQAINQSINQSINQIKSNQISFNCV